MQLRHAGVEMLDILNMNCQFRRTQHTCGTAVYYSGFSLVAIFPHMDIIILLGLRSDRRG